MANFYLMLSCTGLPDPTAGGVMFIYVIIFS